MPSPLRGARKGATTQDISFPLAVAIEHAEQHGQEVAGLLLDRLKCFDRLCRDITFGLQRRAGCPGRLVAARARLYAHLKRYIKIGRCYGEPFVAKNGASQGCAWSVDDIALLMATWVNKLMIKVPAAIPEFC